MYKVFFDIESKVLIHEGGIVTTDVDGHTEFHSYPFDEPGHGTVVGPRGAEALVRRVGYRYECGGTELPVDLWA